MCYDRLCPSECMYHNVSASCMQRWRENSVCDAMSSSKNESNELYWRRSQRRGRGADVSTFLPSCSVEWSAPARLPYVDLACACRSGFADSLYDRFELPENAFHRITAMQVVSPLCLLWINFCLLNEGKVIFAAVNLNANFAVLAPGTVIMLCTNRDIVTLLLKNLGVSHFH